MSSSSQEKRRLHLQSSSWLDRIPSLSDEPTHPAQMALRTYALALSLSLGPSLIPLIISLLSAKARGSSRTILVALKRVLRRELGYDGFAFAVTLAVAGGAALQRGMWHLSLGQNERETTDTKDARSDPVCALSQVEACVLALFTPVRKYIAALSPGRQTFLSNVLSSFIGIMLIQAGRERTSRVARHAQPASAHRAPTAVHRTSPTLDLTLLLFVRAVDSVVQAFILQKHVPQLHVEADIQTHLADPHIVRVKLEKEKIKQVNKTRQKWTSQVDAFVFWACSARIMWCFFYEPQRLPRSYVKWIRTLANLDGRLLEVLKHIRTGEWSYLTGSRLHSGMLQASAVDLGHPPSWGDPNMLPAFGGSVANDVWKNLGVRSRPGVGGLPCEILHGEVGSSLGLTESCTANVTLRLFKGFRDALAIYLPVHFLPVLLTRPQTLIRPHRFLETLIGALRSASFLSSFIGLYWYAVCVTRSLVLAKIFSFVSHDFWDGPYGCVMAGCLMCGSSIWIENGRRRGEMALYVLPRAVRACLPTAWLNSGNRCARFAERVVFILSISTLLTAAIHRPDSLRGLSRWTLAFVTSGPNAGFWKRKRRDPSVPPTPSIPPTPFSLSDVKNEENGPSDSPKHLQ